MGKTHDGSGPRPKKMLLGDGTTLTIPKASVVTIKFE
jgi:hypothetical protein